MKLWLSICLVLLAMLTILSALPVISKIVILASLFVILFLCVCAIGDDTLTFYADDEEFTFASYELVVEAARNYIKKIGGFEKFAEWGLIR